MALKENGLGGTATKYVVGVIISRGRTTVVLYDIWYNTDLQEREV
jgi:hypothetical protein